MISRFGQLIVLGVLLLFVSCSGPTDLAGGVGTETDNTLTGVVMDSDKPAIGAWVFLYPADFNPRTDVLPDSLKQKTNSEGKYKFKISRANKYNIWAERLESERVALIKDILIPEVKDSLFVIPPTHLKKAASFKVNVLELPKESKGYIYVPGTGIIVELDNTVRDSGFVILYHVAPGVYKSMNYVSGVDKRETSILNKEISVDENQNRILGPYAAWTASQKIIINTSTSGANIAEDVIHFPLLIKLDSTHFNFSQSQTAGQDLRFSRSDNLIPLNYQIQSWDANKGVALIWVNVDTIYGNNSTQSITMYTGNSQAISRSSGEAVFNSGMNPGGTWHLEEKSNNNVNGYREASNLALHGTGFGFDPGVKNIGIVGNARVFDGVDDNIVGPMGTWLSGNASFTASFWMNYEPSPNRQWLLYFGKPDSAEGIQFTINDKGRAAFGMIGAGGEGPGQNNFDASPFAGTWVYVTTVRNTTMGTIKTYFNGNLMDTDESLELNLNSERNLVLGRRLGGLNTDDTYYKGSLDEVRITTDISSVSRIKLDYETQKKSSTVVQIDELQSN